MTMPHLSNCAHDPDGWCLACVGQLHDACCVLETELAACRCRCEALEAQVGAQDEVIFHLEGRHA